MFFSNISIAEKYNYLEEKFTCAYKWLAETDINALPAGSYPIMGDRHAMFLKSPSRAHSERGYNQYTTE